MSEIGLHQLEAVLFAAATPLSVDTLADIFEVHVPTMEEAVLRYEQALVEEGRGIRIRTSASGIELVSAQECSEYVTKIRHRDEKLSGPAMETLSVIAFKQPITKGEIEEFRGVNCEKVLKQLLARDMIVELGRKETIGRPVIYGTSDNFLRTVGANSIEELQHSLDIGRCGVASRRKAEELITAGKVLVNGKYVKELGFKVNPTRDRVKVDGQLLEPEALEYYIFNKPKGVITSITDPEGRKTVMDYVQGAKARIYPVGRLDYHTEGLLVLTNDGTLAQNLAHPSKGVAKTYEVKVKDRILDEHLEQLAVGVKLEDGMTSPCEITDYGFSGKTGLTTVEITIHEGRNRQVRRMFEYVGYTIHNLKRIEYAGLNLKGLKRGAFRKLTREEVKQLQAIK